MTYTQPQLSTSALLTIDTQCDFVLPGAIAQIPGTLAIIPQMAALLSEYRQHHLPIIHIIRLYQPDGSNVELCRKSMVELGQSLVAPNTAGAELVDGLKPDPHVRLDPDSLLKGDIQTWGKKEYVIYKSRWGAFYQTPLNAHLTHLGVNTLVVCGCNFPNCPRATIYEASERDYKIVLVEDAISGLYEKGKEELHNIGVRIWSVNKVLNQLKK